jgi:hypothetical protein
LPFKALDLGSSELGSGLQQLQLVSFGFTLLTLGLGHQFVITVGKKLST